jgi:hypothetical protein
MVAVTGIEPRDLKGMNLASCRCSTLLYLKLVRDERVELPFAASETVVLPLDESRINLLAHDSGIEPAFDVSETSVLPLDDS